MRAVTTRAEKQERTREALLDAAQRLFERDGFHATALNDVAGEAGFTKGAIYSNFASKEDLFFAVYERRARQSRLRVSKLLEHADDPAAGLEAVAAQNLRRRRAGDGWLAVFVEFWAHVLRHPEHRDRFAAIHREAYEPVNAAARAAHRDADLPVEPEAFAVALNGMQWALGLERLTQPDVVGPDTGARIARWILEQVSGGQR